MGVVTAVLLSWNIIGRRRGNGDILSGSDICRLTGLTDGSMIA